MDKQLLKENQTHTKKALAVMELINELEIILLIE